MSSWADKFMSSWAEKFMSSWVDKSVGSWVDKFVGSWVYKFMSSWVCKLMSCIREFIEFSWVNKLVDYKQTDYNSPPTNKAPIVRYHKM